MTGYAVPHAERDVPLRDRLMGDIAMARRALDARANVRRVVEAHVGFTREPVHTLPRNLETFLRIARHLFDQRPVGRDLAVADHAGLHARDPRDGPLVSGLVTVGADRLLGEVRLVRKRNRLNGGGTYRQEITQGFARRPVGRREHRRGHLRGLRSARRCGQERHQGQELNAELLEDLPGALWSLDVIDRGRRETAPDLVRVVVAIDPAMSTRHGSDETGIIVAGKCEHGDGYVLEDLSGRYQPADWARVAIEASMFWLPRWLPKPVSMPQIAISGPGGTP